jgi:hypothetical protein
MRVLWDTEIVAIREQASISSQNFMLFSSDFCVFSELPLWSSGQSSWLQIQSSGFDSRRYQIFWEVVGLEQHREYSWEATWKKK